MSTTAADTMAAHEALRETARSFLTRTVPEPEVRRLMATEDGYDPALWKRMAAELEWLGLGLPERFGGAGYGLEELAVVFEETGRALLPAPLFSTVALAATALLESGDEGAAADYLPRIADGTLIAALVLDEPGALPTVEGRRGANGWILSGTVRFILDGHVAGLVLVPAQMRDRLGLFAVEVDAAPADAVVCVPMTTMDETRKQAVVTFVDAPARLISTTEDTATVLDRVRDRAVVALAAEQIGGAARCLEMSVDYARNREQFGRPIGSFQAIKHKCADMLIAVESARSALFQTLRDAETGPAALPASASTAKVMASEAYMWVATETIHVHGGIGFTWEHPAHLYFKRAKTTEVLLGTPAFHRRRFARLQRLLP